MTHPWPPEIVDNEFHHLPLAGVASNWIIMVGFHYVESELTIVGDIDLSSVEY